ncbi:MAG: 4-(cytidine 5'-diphospho)-2-C-methyl-D-erythritol kinase [Flavobacteriales bacterium]|nr:4-(cytidine 5'-diphospho)-2-C-methyl-D-erythritol kinase [Flavobacteriales bacterium]
MVIFPGAKINIGLQVGPKRADGYHTIASVFYPIEWTDVLEVIPADDHVYRLFCSGHALDAAPEGNIVSRAYELMHQRFGIAPVHTWLHKAVPSGAGLGGGSADAASMIALLNKIFKLEIGNDALRQLALELGSDCPFFIERQPTQVGGRGEVMNHYPLSLKGYHLLVVHPGIHVPTAQAYAMLTPRTQLTDNAAQLPSDITQWRDRVVNDFESPVFKAWPAIGRLKEQMYEMGAVYASMSGSGSAVFGIFENAPDGIGLFAGMQTFTSKIEN